MSFVVDASVAVKWVLPEPDSDAARALVGAEPLLAPDFLSLECAQVFAREARRGALSNSDAEAGLRVVESARVRLEPSAPLVHQAQRLALQLQASVYDCLYLAVALNEDINLITADRRFADAVNGSANFAGRAIIL